MVVIMRPNHTAEELDRAIRVMEAGGVNVMISRGSAVSYTHLTLPTICSV